jgi:hypothetical protein
VPIVSSSSPQLCAKNHGRAIAEQGLKSAGVNKSSDGTGAAQALITRTFDQLKRDPKFGRSMALQRAMGYLVKNNDEPKAAHPSIWLHLL